MVMMVEIPTNQNLTVFAQYPKRKNNMTERKCIFKKFKTFEEF
jgi:hypothetical protein